MNQWAKILSTALIVTAIQSSFATSLYDQSKMFYVPFNLGEYLPQSSRQLNNSFYGSLGIGYNFTNVLGLQTQFGYFSPDHQTNFSPVTSYLWTVDARFNAANSTRVVPYLLIGAGALKLTATHFVEEAGVGVDIKVARNFSFGGTAKTVIQNTHSTTFDTLLTGNVTWYFGGNKEIPHQTASQ